MAQIFVSHSSLDNREAIFIRDWLIDQGWGPSQIFVDFDGLNAGDRWRQELNARNTVCEAVILCLSDNWLKSPECLREHNFADANGKKIFPLIVKPLSKPLPRFISDLQCTDICDPSHREAAIQSLRSALFNARIGPGHFPWPPAGQPKRRPYRGLSALVEEDAAIFFGRDAAIGNGLDAVRQMRDGGAFRMLVIQGASGAGKSSFLRAGLLARLRRDSDNFIVMPVARPERAALTGPAGLLHTLGIDNQENLDDSIASRFETLRASSICARGASTRKPPTLVLPIDQAEELFAADHAEASSAIDLLRKAFDVDGNLISLLTIRSDSIDTLQAERRLLEIPRLPFDLLPLAPSAFKEIIEGPGKLAKPPIAVESGLTDRLIADLDAADALPLLAFTMERLADNYAEDGRLSLTDYEQGLAGLRGAIEKAVDAAYGVALRESTPVTSRKELEGLARQAFIPWLVRIADSKSPALKRVATLAELPPSTRPLIDKLIDQRLLVLNKRPDGTITVQVCHEAVLRNWGQLSDWIDSERDTLRNLDTVNSAAVEWQRATQSNDGRNWLNHRGRRLKQAEALLQRGDYSVALGSVGRAYIVECRRTARRRLYLAAVLTSATIVLLGGAVFQKQIRQAATMLVEYRPFARDDRYLSEGGVPDFVECRRGPPDCPAMIVVPAGQFAMGSPADDPMSKADERPQRTIFVSRLAISKSEITFAEWKACADHDGCIDHPHPDPGISRPRSDPERDVSDNPVTNVRWDHAKAYAAWLSHMTGKSYRLLTEAEWEYAARAGTTTPWIWGEDPYQGCAFANHADKSLHAEDPDRAVNALCTDGTGFGTSPVDKLLPNRFGLYDVIGNAWEWVEDCYAPYDPSKSDARPVELSPTVLCEMRVARGGSWNGEPDVLRSASRGKFYPSMQDDAIGFRVAREISAP
jgi:formylglycine-generating enzyme required for sulfatase activity